MKFCITGVTLSGNMGGAAMLYASIQNLRRRYPKSEFDLLSIYPREDKCSDQQYQFNIIDAGYKKLIMFYLPLSLLLWPIRKFSIVRGLLSRINYFKSLYEADAVVDLSGIAFVDGRGIKLLIYNLSVFLPAVILGKKTYKLSQALGPFETRINRIAAKFSLNKCAAVVGRGRLSYNNLQTLKMDVPIFRYPDVTFALEVSAEACKMARKILNQYRKSDLPVAIISPSEVLRRLCVNSKVNFLEAMQAVIDCLQSNGFETFILPHSFAEGGGKNNDVRFCRELYNKNPESSLILDSNNPIMLRALIGLGDVFIGCRFHSIVSAVSMGVPSLVVGWSHKYEEMLEFYNLSRWSLDFKLLDSKTVCAKLEDLIRCRDKVRNEIMTHSADVRRLAAENYNLINL